MSASQEDLRKELALLEELEALEAEELAETTTAAQEPTFLGQVADKAVDVGGELVRQTGLTGRALAGGAAQIAEPFTEPLRYLFNKVLPDKYQIGNIEEATDQALTAVGVPEPQGAVEEGVQTAGRFVTGFAAGFKADDAVMGLLGLSKYAKAGATTSAELREIADVAYKVADDAGVVIIPRGFKTFVDDLSRKMDEFGTVKKLHPNATAALKELRKTAESGEPLKLKTIETLRKVIGDATQATKPADSKAAFMIRNALDDYTNGLGSADVLSGDPKTAMAVLNTARNAWHRLSKSNEIQSAIDLAGINAGSYSGAKFESALIVQFKRIARSIQKGKAKGYSKEEQKAITKIIQGGNIQNGMRLLANLAPSTKNALSMGNVATGAAATFGGPAAAAAVASTGVAAKAGARAITNRKVDKLGELVRTGGPVPTDAPEWLLPWLSGTIIGADTQ
jgi:hypothetical protein